MLMMGFKLYGSPSPLSTYTRLVAMIAKERNIPYEFIPVDLQKGDNKQLACLEHHPFGQVPYIIVRHLFQPLPVVVACYAWSLTSWLSSKTTGSSCSNRVLSAATSQPSGLAPS